MSTSNPTKNSIRDDAITIWKAGVAAVHGRKLVENALSIHDGQLHVRSTTDENVALNLSDFDRIVVVGGGKFSHLMAEGLEEILGAEIASRKQLSGLVSVPDGAEQTVKLKFVAAVPCRPAGENFPTPRVLDATQRMIDLLDRSDERTLIVSLISGGGSALLEQSDLPLDDIVAATKWLSGRGADILQLNTVRIAMSNIKGGGLARAMKAGRMVSLIVSDVPGDDVSFVSSGPTVQYSGDAKDNARKTLAEFNAENDDTFPQSVIAFLRASTRDAAVSLVGDQVTNLCIGDSRTATQSAQAAALGLGYRLATNDSLSKMSTAEKVGLAAAEFCLQHDGVPAALISIGEPTVEPGSDAGRGGRNQHAALVALESLLSADAVENVAGEFCFLSAGTDGEDGNTSVAGGVFQRSDLAIVQPFQEQAKEALRRFDSHSFLHPFELVFDSGPTGTNVCDLRIVLRR